MARQCYSSTVATSMAPAPHQASWLAGWLADFQLVMAVPSEQYVAPSRSLLLAAYCLPALQEAAYGLASSYSSLAWAACLHLLP
jgi:hypothetical protein